jgi:hypothetical protein
MTDFTQLKEFTEDNDTALIALCRDMSDSEVSEEALGSDEEELLETRVKRKRKRTHNKRYKKRAAKKSKVDLEEKQANKDIDKNVSKNFRKKTSGRLANWPGSGLRPTPTTLYVAC